MNDIEKDDMVVPELLEQDSDYCVRGNLVFVLQKVKIETIAGGPSGLPSSPPS